MAGIRRPNVVVFDFDGTLVDSNGPKRDAFFRLFPDPHDQHPVVNEVLEKLGEESRYVIVREILDRLGQRGGEQLQAQIQRLAKRYNELALEAAASCREMPGASRVLAQLSASYSLYASSGTPREPLETLISNRGWLKHFKGLFGYPDTKVESLGVIADRESCHPAAMLVVGDGASDRNAAVAKGCGFYPAGDDGSLERLARLLA